MFGREHPGIVCCSSTTRPGRALSGGARHARGADRGAAQHL